MKPGLHDHSLPGIFPPFYWLVAISNAFLSVCLCSAMLGYSIYTLCSKGLMLPLYYLERINYQIDLLGGVVEWLVSSPLIFHLLLWSFLPPCLIISCIFILPLRSSLFVFYLLWGMTRLCSLDQFNSLTATHRWIVVSKLPYRFSHNLLYLSKAAKTRAAAS